MTDNTLKIPCNTCGHHGICKCENDVSEFAQKIAEIRDQYKFEIIESIYVNCCRYVESKPIIRTDWSDDFMRIGGSTYHTSEE